tara:strand:+ start:3631 stop:4125 length:495 start_codon:yes stop_codon:yes gene_type:complete
LKNNPEFQVYKDLIELLEQKKWKIICASPPGGTDNRFRKCLFPRRILTSSEKGPRDELDVIALKNEQLLLIECKPLLSQSLKHQNALGESDYHKLNRILTVYPSKILANMLQKGTGINISQDLKINLALGVGKIDCDLPKQITIFEVGFENRIFPYESLKNEFT